MVVQEIRTRIGLKTARKTIRSSKCSFGAQAWRTLSTPVQCSRCSASTYDWQMATALVAVDLEDKWTAGLAVNADLRLCTGGPAWRVLARFNATNLLCQENGAAETGLPRGKSRPSADLRRIGKKSAPRVAIWRCRAIRVSHDHRDGCSGPASFALDHSSSTWPRLV